MIEIFIKSISSMRHRAIWWIMLASIMAAMFISLALVWLVDHLLTIYKFTDILWVEKLIDNSGTLAALFFAWLLFPVTVPVIASLFEDKAAQIVELNEYGASENVHSYPWIKEIGFLLQGFLYNFLLLPVYVIPVLNIFVYYLLNSWLVGKGLFMLVATRYHGREGAGKLWQSRSLEIKLYGVALVFMSTIPLLNLIMPLLGIIIMVHYSRRFV